MHGLNSCIGRGVVHSWTSCHSYVSTSTNCTGNNVDRSVLPPCSPCRLPRAVARGGAQLSSHWRWRLRPSMPRCASPRPTGATRSRWSVREGQLTYSLARDGRTLILPSLLGFEFRGAPPLRDGPAHHRHHPPVARRVVDPAVGRGGTGARPPQRAGRHRGGDHGAAPALHPAGPRLRRRRRASATSCPKQPGLGAFEISDELTEFALADNARAWWIPSNWARKDRSEMLYSSGPVSVLDSVQTPLTHGDPGRPHVHGDPRGQPGGLRPDVPAGDPHREPPAHGRPGADGRRDQGARPHPVRDALANHPAGRQGHRPGALGARPQPQSAERARQHRLDPPHEVRRDLVGHAHRHHDLELGPEARGHDREYQAIHRLRRGQRVRRRAGRGLEHRLGRRLDRESGCVLVHPVISRLRPEGGGRVRPAEGCAADRPQRDLGRDPELRAPAG